MCEVVRSTFAEAFPFIVRDIEQAAFIAIDTEFTGLVLSEKQKPSLFDDGEARYQKLKSSMSQFTLSQIGIACYKEEPAGNVYSVQTYNIPLLPACFGPLDVKFMWQTSSIQFMCQHKFDFNKVAYEGVGFLNEAQENLLQQHIDGKVLMDGLDRNVDEQCLQHCCSLVANWLTTAEQGDSFQLTKLDFESVPIYIAVQEMRQRFETIWAHEINAERINLECIDSEKKAALEETAANEERERIRNEQLGFTRVFRELVRCKKPLVGHNCLTDLVLFYEKFHRPLPSTFAQFKRLFNELFPVVYDTKYFCSVLRNIFQENGFFERSGLGSLYNAMQGDDVKFYYLYSPSVRHMEGFDRYTDLHCPHEAGYDAYMAGSVFLRMAHMLTMHGMKVSKTRPLSFSDYQEALLPHENKCNIIRASINYVHMGGQDPASRRPELLYVRSRGSKPLHMGHLGRLFSAHGSVDIQMKGQKEALVAAGNFRCSKDIMAAFRKHEDVYVTKYRVWKHSPVVSRLLWTGILVSGSVCVWGLLTSFSGQKTV